MDETWFPANISWSEGSLQDVFKTCLEDVFNTSSVKQFSVFKDVLKTSSRLFVKTSWRCLEEILEDVLKTSWRRLGRQKIFRLKTSLRRLEEILKTCLEDVLRTCLEDVLKMLWGQTNYLLGTSLSNKSKYASNKSVFHKYLFDNSKANPKCIKTHHFNICLILKIKQHLYFKN